MWYKGGYKPNLEEYMQNAWISISSPTIFVHFYCVFSDQLSVQVLETLSEHQQNIVRCSSSVFRLANDLVTSPVNQFLPSLYNFSSTCKIISRSFVTNCNRFSRLDQTTFFIIAIGLYLGKIISRSLPPIEILPLCKNYLNIMITISTTCILKIAFKHLL